MTGNRVADALFLSGWSLHMLGMVRRRQWIGWTGVALVLAAALL